MAAWRRKQSACLAKASAASLEASWRRHVIIEINKAISYGGGVSNISGSVAAISWHQNINGGDACAAYIVAMARMAAAIKQQYQWHVAKSSIMSSSAA